MPVTRHVVRRGLMPGRPPAHVTAVDKLHICLCIFPGCLSQREKKPTCQFGNRRRDGRLSAKPIASLKALESECPKQSLSHPVSRKYKDPPAVETTPFSFACAAVQ